MDVSVFLSDPVFVGGAALLGLGVLALLAETVFPSVPKAASAASVKVAAASEKVDVAAVVAEAAAVELPKDPVAEQRRFFATLGAALSVDEDAPVALAALHTNLTSEMFMERMTLAVKSWRPDGFAVGARDMLLKADGTPPDTVSTKVSSSIPRSPTTCASEIRESASAADSAQRGQLFLRRAASQTK